MTDPGPKRSEAVIAARNALTLGTSLAITGGIALLVRLLIPRFLGPSAFGELRLAESFAEMLFVVLTFGVDIQMRLEAAVHPSRVRSYLCGLVALRLGLGAAAIAAVVVLLQSTGSSERVVVLFVLIAFSQILLVLNNSYAALEHAAGDVGWLARANFVFKALWAVVMIAVLTRIASGLAIAIGALSVEVLRVGWFTTRAIRRHGLLIRPDVRLAAAAVVASLPIFVNAVAHNLYARIGIAWLGIACSEFEVGLYAAASNVAAVALLGMPLLSWVLVPSAARAASNSDEEANRMVAGALRISLLVGVPLAVAFHIGAAFCLQVLFGREYMIAAPVLQIMAPTVSLAYVSTVCAITLIQRGRTWTVAAISLGGVAATMLLASTLIPWGARTLGQAGGAQGAAWAALATEALVTVALGAISRTAWLEARLLRTAAALLCGVAGVALVVRFMPVPAIGLTLAAAVAFATGVLAFGGVDRHDLMFCRRVLTRSRRQSPGVLSREMS